MTSQHGTARITGFTAHRSPFRRLRSGLGGEMLAEFFGTFALLLLGDGSVAVAGLPGPGRQAPGVAFGPANWLMVQRLLVDPIAGPLAGGVAGILAYDLFIGQILRARQQEPAPPPEPGRAPEPAARRKA